MANLLRPHARRLPGDFSGSTWSGGKETAHSGEKLVMLLANVHRRQALGECGVLRQRTRKKKECMVKKLVVFVDVCCAAPNCREFA